MPSLKYLMEQMNACIQILSYLERIIPEVVGSSRGKEDQMPEGWSDVNKFCERYKFISRSTMYPMLKNMSSDKCMKTPSKLIFDEVHALEIIIRYSNRITIKKFKVFCENVIDLKNLYHRLKEEKPGMYEEIY